MTGSRARYWRDLRRFLFVAFGLGFVFAALGRIWGEDVALGLQETPTTREGWLLLGWLIGGPPVLATFLAWNGRRRMRPETRMRVSYGLALWLALGAFILPARVGGSVDEQFGTGALVGDPLSAGWAWGSLANLIGLAFTAAVLGVLHTTAAGGPTRTQRNLTTRFLERAWVVLLAVSLGFALYGSTAGLIQTG